MSGIREIVWSSISMHVVHMTAASVWMGGLLGLLAALRQHHHNEGADWKNVDGVIRRFSSIALWMILAMIATGAGLIWARLESWDELVTTRYGQLLIVKIALLLVVIGIGIFHRRVFIPSLADLSERSGMSKFALFKRFKLGVQWELIIGTTALVVAGVLSSTGA